MPSPCPRCGGTYWWEFDYNDVSCMTCGYIKVGESNQDDLCANLMAQPPSTGHGPDCDCKGCRFGSVPRQEGLDARKMLRRTR